jgi:SprT protein
MKDQIVIKVLQCFKQAEDFYGRKFSRPNNIIFKRKGTWGGYCNFTKKELMFQLDFAEHHKEDFLNRTVPHEVAHWIDKEVNGYQYKGGRRDIHGKSWQDIMIKVYGLEPSRCHNYDISVTKVKGGRNYVYECKCKEHHLSSIRHNRIRRGTIYSCNLCGGELKFKCRK